MSNKIKRLSMTDLSGSGRGKFIDELFLGLKEYGFVVLQDHSIRQSQLDQAYQLATAFFDLPLDIKMKYDSGQGGARGYTSFGRENAKGNPYSDLKEFWHVGQEVGIGSPYRNVYPANLWPAELPEFKTVFQQLFRDLETLGKTVLEALGEAMELEQDFFRNLVKEGNSICRILHYPSVAGLDTSNSMRAAAHADINLLTLLVGATDSGLELLDKDGNWMPVVSDETEIVLDTGDMMSRLTNELLPSTVHRVVNPMRQDTSRYSMPFFLHPHNGANLECLPQCSGDSGPKYPPITAGEFLDQRLKEIGLTTT
ncbi:MAG: isopenicillin N synthase family oxygenase [Gammaproteobacteria bacterium]|nr:isopenicillin N synthase family oxygenase [Gammaproteobacteria bacterium]